MKKIVLSLILNLILVNAWSQTGKDFWFAAPDITDLHNIPGGEPLYLFVSSAGAAGTVTITQPANPTFNGGVPITVSLTANASAKINLTPFKALLETRPTNSVINTGLHIVSTTNITAYYEISNTNNAEIFALKGANALGTEFYIPLQKYAPFYNHTFAAPHTANASFDIVATQSGTTVTIYSPTPVDGHAALQQFSITLNAGQTYSCAFTGASYEQPINHPGGAVVLSDKPIAITIKDDSDHNPSGGCYDVVGDQIVPVNVLGTEYIAVKGQLNATGDESVFITATQNNTQVYINGSGSSIATLFAGESYRYDMDYLSGSAVNSVYITTSKPVYATHYTGFGCEMGMALLPQLGCAGSRQVSFVRSNTQSFFITFLVRSTAVNNFTITGSGTATINPALFITVPGTGGVWKAANIQYTTANIPKDSTFRISNTADVFAMGIINGGAATGCSYGYFSEFSATVAVDAGPDQTVCANNTVQLAGAINGGAVNGIWTTNGSGTFSPSTGTLNAVYTPSSADTTIKNIRFLLTSTGSCKAVTDTMNVTFTSAPRVNAGNDQNICGRDTIRLNGSVTGGAVTGLWSSSGTGIFYPNAATLNANYIPSAADETTGSVIFSLISTSNGTCQAMNDTMVSTIQKSIAVNAGSDATRCANNPALNLVGSVTGGTTTGIWSSTGSGTFNPNSTNLSTIYYPSNTDTTAGSIFLILTSSNNNFCSAKKDTLLLSFLRAPVVVAGADQTICANSFVATLSGTARNCSGTIWSSTGTGTFSPSTSNLNATYTASAADILAGSIKLYLQSTGPASCLVVKDSLSITINPSPVVNAGSDKPLCVSNLSVQLNGLVSGITNTGIWTSNGTGSFIPNSTTLNAIYQLNAADSLAGTVRLILTSSNNNTCLSVKDTLLITVTPAGYVNAGNNFNYCANSNPPINGTKGGSVTNAIWSTTGSGSFSASTNQLNQYYVPSSSDTADGFVYLILTGNSCETPKDTVTITFTPAPNVIAGNDQYICGRDTVRLTGTVSGGSTSGTWSGTGTGAFLPNTTSLGGKYYPSSLDVQNGQVKLYLTSTSNGTCTTVRDSLTLYFTPAIALNAGSDISVCANNFSVALNGQVSGGTTSGQWTTSGNGFFSPNANLLNATYIPTANDTASGFIYLYLQSVNNGNCPVKKDTVRLNFFSAPVITAGADQTICANNPIASLSGTARNSSGTLWSSTGTGTFSPFNSNLNATYTASAADILSGSVKIYLQSTGPASCVVVKDSLIITINPSPVVNAGSDKISCVSNLSVQLNGLVSGITNSGNWSSNGSGNFTPNSATLSAVYKLSAADSIAGSVKLILTSSNNNTCLAVRDTMLITVTPAGIVNAGNDFNYCANSNPPINGTKGGSVSIATWSTSGSGTFSAPLTQQNQYYEPSSSDTADGFVYLILTGNSCETPKDTVKITFTPAPNVIAGNDQYVCGRDTVQLTGSVSGGSASGIWSGTGTGAFLPNATSLGGKYYPSSLDVSNGQVKLYLTSTSNGTCTTVRDSLTLYFTPAITLNAGSDISVCANNFSVALNGLVSGGTTSGQWTTSGNGFFSPNANLLNATYIPTANDTASGFIYLYLQSVNNGNCPVKKDTVKITFNDAPLVSAGTNLTICKNNPVVQLNASSVSNAVNYTWTGNGTGTFGPNNTTLHPTYTASAGDITNGQVTLYLSTGTTTGCLIVSDSILLSITPSPVVYAGSDISLCRNNLNVQLNGIVTGPSSTGIWTSTGTGNFLPDAITLNAIYQLSYADSVSGNINLVLTSSNNGNCLSVHDTINIRTIALGLVNAGINQTICASSTAQLNGSITGSATAGNWISTGSGTFTPSSNSLQAVYHPSSADTSAGYVRLILTGNSCENPSDTINLEFISIPFVDAGVAQTICANNANVQLAGTIYNATGGLWTGGSGTFNPGSNNTTTTYIPSSAEINQGFANLILTSTGNGICQSNSANVHIDITTAPVVNAGTDIDLCKLTTSVQLQGNISGPTTTGQWSSSGTGSFNPTGNILNCFYTLSPGDTANSTVELILTSTSNGNCLAASDTVIINLSEAVHINAGTDQSVCANDLKAVLNGSVSGGATKGRWVSSGTGIYFPNDSNMHAKYLLSSADSLAGGVTIVLESTGSSLCPASADTVALNVKYVPEVNAGADILRCPVLDPISLIGSIQNATKARWTSSGTGVFSPSDTAMVAYYIPSPQDTVLKTIYISLSSENSGGCFDKTDTLELVFDNLLHAEFISGNGCEDHILNFSDNSVLPGGNQNYWFWNFSDGSTSLQQNPDHTFDQPGNYQVSLLTKSDNGCTGLVSHTVNIYPSPIAGYSTNAASFSPGEAINFINTGTGYIGSWWNFGDSAVNSTSENPIHTYANPGTYSVIQIVSNQFGCSDSLRNDIVINDDELNVYPPELPTAFSPNDDGVNDVLFVRGGPFKTLSFTVYDEWGHQLFSSIKASDGWDGTNGKPLPVGVYLYTVNALNTKNEQFNVHGEVKLIR